MHAYKRLIGLGLTTLVMAAAEDARATPLQSGVAGVEPPRLGDVRLDLGGPATGAAVDTVIDFSATGGLAGSAPLSPVVGDRLLAPRPPPDPLATRPPLGPPGTASSGTSSPALEFFREIISEAANAGPAPGLAPVAAAAGAPHRGAAGLAGEQQTTLKDLVRALINRPENLGLDAPVQTSGAVTGPAAAKDDSILSTILSIAVDKEIVQAVSGVLRPSIDIQGVVALNLFGLREIALLVSPGSNSIRMIDLGTGRSMSFRYEDRGLATQNRHIVSPPGTPQVKSGRENLLPTVIASIRRWIATYVFNGITLITLLALLVFWAVWRFARSGE